MNYRTRAMSLVCGLGIFWQANAGQILPVQGENAEIHITSGVVNFPCSIALDSRDQTIELPPVGSNKLAKPGDRSEIIWFTIQLRNCLPVKTNMLSPQGLNRIWERSGPAFEFVFSGAQELNNTSLFSISGIARGIGLRMFNSKNGIVYPGLADRAIFAHAGDNWLVYGVATERSFSALRVGNYKGTVDFQIKYD